MVIGVSGVGVGCGRKKARSVAGSGGGSVPKLVGGHALGLGLLKSIDILPALKDGDSHYWRAMSGTGT